MDYKLVRPQVFHYKSCEIILAAFYIHYMRFSTMRKRVPFILIPLDHYQVVSPEFVEIHEVTAQ